MTCQDRTAEFASVVKSLQSFQVRQTGNSNLICPRSTKDRVKIMWLAIHPIKCVIVAIIVTIHVHHNEWSTLTTCQSAIAYDIVLNSELKTGLI